MQTHPLNTVSLALVSLFALLCSSAPTAAASEANPPAKAPEAAAADKTPKAIPWGQIGAKAGADYQGEGLTVTPTAEGARLHCVFQRLDGEATREGLWLTSTVANQANDRFRVRAAEVGRDRSADLPSAFGERESKAGHRPALLASAGDVSIDGQTVRLSRPGLVEEYSVSLDGVRQDFVVTEKPPGAGELAVRLEVRGAMVEAMAGGARLVLAQSGRKIAYSRIRATDANGRELPARMEVVSVGDEIMSRESNADTGQRREKMSQSLLTSAPGVKQLAVVVNDAEAVYPVRIDPTFSDANWVSFGGFAGADGGVYAAVADGSGNLYIGGGFTVVGNTNANYIAKWDGSSWSALGSGMNSYVYALAVSGGTLYVGGAFTTAGGSAASRIAQWDGSSWSALGSGMNSYVYALAVSGGTLYAGGGFWTAGGNAANSIAQWDGSSWSALGSGMNNDVYALAVSGDTLYAGGGFWTAGGSAANHIAQWNGSSWLPLGSGMNDDVRALAVSGTTLYAGGEFTTVTNIGGVAVTANHIAQWNGSGWLPLGSGMNDDVRALAVSGSVLYVGGTFTTATNSGGVPVPVNRIAQWNGSGWSGLGPGLNDAVVALAVSGGTLYAGGHFWTAGGNAANYIAQWNGSSWSRLGPGGVNGGGMYALVVSEGTLYAGGNFTTAGGSAANYIAQWNGSSWSALGSGMNSDVYALAVSGGTLYAGGNFTAAGGSAANHIAQWNGSSWSALGAGMGGGDGYPCVYALAVSGGTLYAGGNFTTAGGSPANHIAQWNGSSWSAVGDGQDGFVCALAVSGGTLYAGGGFWTAGGIAAWDGSSWSALGAGVNGTVEALAVSGGTLYAGGSFTTAGGSAANYIAQWNGSSWSALGAGMAGGPEAYPYVCSLAVSGGTLYAGGAFATAGGIPASCIAQWDGSRWSALGSGVNDPVWGLAVSGTNLYAGGRFSTAGGKVSGYVARAVISPPTILTQPQSTNVTAGRNAFFTVSASGSVPLSCQWLKEGNALANGGNLSGVTTDTLTVSNVSVTDQGYYQVVVANACGSVTSAVAVLTVLPINDECSGAIALGENVYYSQLTVNATDDDYSPCLRKDRAKGVWFTYTAPQTGTALVDTCPSDFDSNLEIFTGTCGALTSIGCSEFSSECGYQAAYRFACTAGTTYLIYAGGRDGASGILVTRARIVPDNDLCGGAIALPENVYYSQGTTNATDDNAAPCLGLTPSKGVWFTYTPALTGSATVDTCPSDFDTFVEVFTGPCNNLVLMNCNNDALACSVTNRSSYSFGCEAGTTYTICAGGYNGASGNLQIRARVVQLPPANDHCGGPGLALSENVYRSLNTDGATDDGVSTCLGVTRSKGAWFTYTPAQSGVAIVDTCPSDFDTLVEVFTGACSNLVTVGCNHDSAACGTPNRSSCSFVCTAGTPYWICAGGNNGASGNLQIRAQVVPPLPNDTCSGAIALGENVYYPEGTTNATDDGFSTCLGATRRMGVWFTYTPGQNGTATVDTCPSDFDTVLEVFSGGCTNLYSAGCHNGYPTGCGVTNRASYSFGCSVGMTYTICAAGKNGAVGHLQIRASVVPMAPPNDQCSKAVPLFENIYYSANTYLAFGNGVSTCLGVTRTKQVWYTYTPARSGTATVDTCPSDFDTLVEVFTGTCSNLTTVACNNDSPACGVTNRASCSFVCTTGTTYRICAGGHNGAWGNLYIRAHTLVSPRPPQLAFELGTGNTMVFTISGDVGHVHDIQECGSLSAPDWQTTSSVTLTSDPQSFVWSRPTSTTFWRVVAH